MLTLHGAMLTLHFGLLTLHFAKLTAHFAKVSPHFAKWTLHFAKVSSHFAKLAPHIGNRSLHFASSVGRVSPKGVTRRMAPVLSGYRGKPAANILALIDAIEAIARYAEAHADTLLELDVNPLIARAQDAVAVDALIIRTA